MHVLWKQRNLNLAFLLRAISPSRGQILFFGEKTKQNTLPLKTCESDIHTPHIQIYSISMTLTFYCWGWLGKKKFKMTPWAGNNENKFRHMGLNEREKLSLTPKSEQVKVFPLSGTFFPSSCPERHRPMGWTSSDSHERYIQLPLYICYVTSPGPVKSRIAHFPSKPLPNSRVSPLPPGLCPATL